MVNAAGALDVDSEVTYPFVWQINNPDGFQADDFFGSDGESNLLSIINGKLGIDDQLINNWADSGVKAATSEVSLSGSIDFLSFNNDNEARIDAGALINQDPLYQSSTQTVSVTSSTTYDAINFVGNTYIDLSPDALLKAGLADGATFGFVAAATLPATQASVAGVGASVLYSNFDNTTTAVIGDVHTFDPTASGVVDASAHTVDLGYSSNFATGQEVVYFTNGGTAMTGLVNGLAYYVIADPSDGNKVQLASSYANAIAGTALPISASGASGGDQSLQAVNDTTQTFNGAQVSANKISLGYDPGFTTGEAVVYGNGGGTGLSGNGSALVNGQVYYVILVTGQPDEVELAATFAQALAGTAMTLTAGSGMSQSLIGLGTQVNFGAASAGDPTSAGVTVNASTTLFNLNLATSGGAGPSGAQLAFNGTFSYFGETSTTEAQVATGTDLTSDPGTEGAVNVTATDDSVVVGFATSRVSAKNISIGVSGVLNEVTRNAYAVVGSNTGAGTSALGSNWDVGGNVNVTGTETGTILNIATSFATSSAPAAAKPDKDGNVPMAPLFANYGIAVSGDASLSLITDNTEAYFNDIGTFVAQAVDVTATDFTVMIGLGGSWADQINIDKSLSSTNGAVSGSFTMEELDGDTDAFVQGADISFASLTVHAERDNYIGTFTAGLGTAGGMNSFAIAGSVSIDIFNGDTNAYLNNVTGTVSGDLTVTAADKSIIVAITGAIGEGKKAGVGIAVSFIDFTHAIEAYASGTDLTVGGNIDIEATALTAIGAAALTGGFTSGKMSFVAGAGSFAIDEIQMTLMAFVTAGSELIAAGMVTVKSTDNPYIVSVSGGLAVGTSGGSVGAAVSYNLISDVVESYIDGSTVEANGGTLTVSANSTPVLANLTAGLAAGNKLAVGFGIAINSIADSVAAFVESSHIISSGNTSVTATESAVLVAVSGALGVAESSGSGPAVGVAIAYNYVGGVANDFNPDVVDHASQNTDSDLAYIDSSTVSVGGTLTVAAGFSPPSTLPSTSVTAFAGAGNASVLDLTIPVTIDNQLVSIAVAGGAEVRPGRLDHAQLHPRIDPGLHQQLHQRHGGRGGHGQRSGWFHDRHVRRGRGDFHVGRLDRRRRFLRRHRQQPDQRHREFDGEVHQRQRQRRQPGKCQRGQHRPRRHRRRRLRHRRLGGRQHHRQRHRRPHLQEFHRHGGQ